MKTIAIFFSLFILDFSFLSQENHTLSGYVMDGKTGEILIGAQVSIPALKIASTTNSYGFYSLTVPGAVYKVEFKFIGMDPVIEEIDLNKDIVYNYEFSMKTSELIEVVVNANKKSNINDTKIGQIELGIETIKTLPAFMGEVDVMKSIPVENSIKSKNLMLQNP